jgi:L-rhamnose mutarotase
MSRINIALLLMMSLLYLDVGAVDIYVAIGGADTNTGAKENPLATLHGALRKARELRRLNDPSIKGGIRIIIKNGVYYLEEPVVIRPEDSGSADSPTEVVANANGKAIFSGGTKISGWKKVTGNLPGLPRNAVGKVWVAGIPNPGAADLQFRQLWVNGEKAINARYYNGDEMGRILSWDAGKETCKIPLPKKINPYRTLGMEMLIHQWWAVANLRVKSLKPDGNKAELYFMQPESRIQSEHPWPAPWISGKTGNSAFNLYNSIQFLDEPGEWFEDLINHKIYYWPKTTQNPAKAEVIVPVLENLLKVEGDIDHPVSYLFFKGITFRHSSWLRPSKKGHVPHQAGMYMLDAYKLQVPGTAGKKTLENQAWVGRPAAAVELNYANHVNFESCTFEHHASTGLDYGKGTHDNIINGNLFKDIGGSAILIGTFSDESTEVHLPYQPKDLRVVSTYNTIENNLITDVTNEDWGAVGIGAGYVSGLKILHNEICDVSYSGISIGWGWTKAKNVMNNNVILGNKIHHYGKHMYDVAGIYTLSAQPGSLITENEIDSIYKAPYAHLPEHWFYLYTDEGSSGFSIKDNWTPDEKYLQNANGAGNVWKDNGPDVSLTIRKNSGLAPPFQYLLKEKTRHPTQAINRAADKPVIFELIFNDGIPPPAVLKTFAEENNLKSSAIYSWNNRLVIYTSNLKVESLQQTLKRLNPITIKLYEDLIYNFSRTANCGLDRAKEWDNIILSANLVKDQKLQAEYLDYHKTQFEKWPELSKGFCNAEFQQLAIYKNGRQLMLIISIPKGKNLDELNPKTTENNPKVNEWNAMMKKYQEGIDGTKPNEVWVFFKPLDQ